MPTSVAARTDTDLPPDAHCGCPPHGAVDITDLPNREAGRCVLCGAWVVRRAGWRVRGRGCWLGVACDHHENPAAPRHRPDRRPTVRREGLVERANRLAAEAREREAAGRLPI